MAAYRILSLDGGGIRGVMTARLLERIEERVPGFLGRADLLAGTSTGSILAVGLAKGLGPGGIRELYENDGPSIFKHNFFDDLADGWGLVHAKYATAPRLKALKKVFGDTTLGQLGKRVVVATFDLDSTTGPSSKPVKRTWKPKFFHNFPGADSDGAERAVDVVMRSSAAPVYFPIYQNFVDGGVVANNPSVCAVAQALNPGTGGQVLQDLRVLSLGTGFNAQWVTSDHGDWGVMNWGFKLVDMLMDGAVGLADYQCAQLLGECYRRVNVDLGESIGMDDVDAIPRLLALADGVDLDPIVRWLGEQWS